MKEITLDARVENLDTVIGFINGQLSALRCPEKIRRQIDTAASELFTNISYYAYHPETGPATICVEVRREPLSVVLTFMDHGVPYDPLKREDPNTALPLEEREEGGLGIFIVKKSMDAISYEYRDGQNILHIQKNIAGG